MLFSDVLLAKFFRIKILLCCFSYLGFHTILGQAPGIHYIGSIISIMPYTPVLRKKFLLANIICQWAIIAISYFPTEIKVHC